MKITRIIRKNFKLLLRSKTTALVVIVAPLLIILLAGIAFNNSGSEAEFKIGIYRSENTSLSDTFIAQLENNSFSVDSFSDNESCKNAVKESIAQACILFPENFNLEDTSQEELLVYADYSRRNFVFYLMETISKSLETRTSELSISLTNNILDALNNAKEKNIEANLKIVQMKANLDTISTSADSIKSKLNALDTGSESVAISGATGDLDRIKVHVKSLRNLGVNALSDGLAAGDEALSYYPNLADWGNDNETYDIINEAADLNDSSIQDKYNTTIASINNLISELGNASEAVEKMEEKLKKVSDFKTTGSADLEKLKTSLTETQKSADEIKTILETVNNDIENIGIKSAETIVEPIKTTVEPIVSETNNINYMFPYLVMLIVMFVSILLSSTMIIMEKKSKAYFRNFSTPTSDFTFTISTYLTTIIILLMQLLVLFVIAYFVLNIPVINNWYLSLLLLFISITLFSAIGMGIGYWLASQEAVIMLSMSVGSLFLLVSNLILPLETMPATVQMIAGYNPYVMLSELLRQIIVFNIIPKTAAFSLSLLGVVALLIFLLILLIQKVSKFSYFQKLPHTKKQKGAKKKEIIHHKSFKLYERTIENEIDLLNELKNMDDATFATYVNKDKNDFYNWAKYMLKDKKLATKLKVKSRTEMINAIENQ